MRQIPRNITKKTPPPKPRGPLFGAVLPKRAPVKAKPPVRPKPPARPARPPAPRTSPSRPTVSSPPATPRVASPRPPAARPKPPLKPRPPTRSQAAQPDTSAQDAEQAYIDSIINPGREQLDYLMQQQQAQDQQRIAGLKQMTDQFMSYLNSIPGQVQSDYGTMINQQMNMGREAQQALAAASTNPATQADLAAIGAGPGQSADVAGKLGQAFEGGGAVLLGTGGQIPAQQLSADQAAQLAFARSLPAVAAAQGQQTLRGYLQDSQKATSDLNNWFFDNYLSKIPQLRQDYQQSVASNAAKQAQLDLEYKAFGLKRQNQSFQQAATRAKITQSAQKAQASNALRFAEIYGYNPKTGQPTLAAIKAAKADKKKSRKPVSAAALKNWNKFAEDAYHGVAPKTRYDAASGQFIPIPGTGKPPVPYYPALKRVMAMGATLAQAQKILNSLYAKGEAGRPYVSLQGRIGLQRAGMPMAHPNDVPTQAQINWLRQHGLWSD